MKKVLVSLLIAFIFILSGCEIVINGNGNNKETAGDLIEETKRIENSGEKNLDIKINEGVGKFTIKGGEEDILNAKFSYNIKSWKPEVDYNKDNGELKISHPMKSTSASGNVKCIWEVGLNKNIPTKISLSLGVGDSRVDLKDLNLKELAVEAGVGNVEIDLTGKYEGEVEAKVEGGVGNITIYLPKDIGVFVTAKKGVGKINAVDFINKGNNSYANESYGKTKNSIKLDVEAGVGRINLILK